MSLNAQGLINADTKWKIDMLKEHVSVNNIVIMNFTETWFKKEDQDEKYQIMSFLGEIEKGERLKRSSNIYKRYI